MGLKCEKCGGENFRGVREEHKLTGYKCVKCGAVSPLKKSAVKSGLKFSKKEVE